MTIDKHVLFEILKKKVKDEDLLWLARVIIFHNPAENFIIKGKQQLLGSLPPHKSLLHAGKDRGLPVGNLTSQFFANLYLNELDQYVKHTLKCRYYVRYCDDFLIVDRSAARLEELKKDIGRFVEERLHLSLNDKHGVVAPVSNGIDFLGYIIRQDYVLVRRRVVNNLKARLNGFEKDLIAEKDGVTTVRYDYEILEQLRAVLASYMGHLKWADTYRLRAALLKRYGFLKEYFVFREQKITPRYKHPKMFPSIIRQYRYYAGRFRDSVIFFQVGCFYEFYEDVKEEVIVILRLLRLKENRKGVKYGFPIRLEAEYLKRVVSKGISVVIIKETDRYIGKIKERLPICLYGAVVGAQFIAPDRMNAALKQGVINHAPTQEYK